ncbi:hypothetical protein [Brevundimonas sp. Root1279]|uniref:hypothetical protein n=1 Tax=Brevundimonas sp. Root1279 TaxID=1736443 RepID=UPI0006F79AE8|nr:hypothetical protein [Brevundimonas sp. Root1279]KQW79679.1 hypothetical protein ASC65_14100 [Brevundimonas sp. Root1279]
MLVSMLALALLTTQEVLPPQPVIQAASAAPAAEPERRVCRNERVTGTHRRQRVCLTRTEQEHLQFMAERHHNTVVNDRPTDASETDPGAAPAAVHRAGGG